MFNRLPSISKQYFSQSRVNPFRFAFPLIPTNLSPSNFYFKQMTTSSTTNLSDIEDLNQSCGFKRAELLDETISCADSVSDYQKHVFLLTNVKPTLWSESIGHTGGMRLLKKQFAARSLQLGLKTKITLAFDESVDVDKETASVNNVDEDQQEPDDSPSPPNRFALLLFPNNVQIQTKDASTESIEELLDFVYKPSSVAEDKKADGGETKASENLEIRNLQQTSIFVCSHANRDQRCGYCGPRLQKAIDVEVEKNNSTPVKTFPCSHVGGHKFAGNVLVFSKQIQGEWFGYVTPDTVPSLLQYINDKQTAPDDTTLPANLQSLFRGKMNVVPNKQ